MWPETREYDRRNVAQAGEMVHADGRPSMLYTPHHCGPVVKHTQWMRQYGIDGVFLSRFIVSTKNALHFRHVNMVLNHIRKGCHANGRVWALIYDDSGIHMTTDDIKNDWKYLCDVVGIREDSRYLHHNGKPLVLIWGFGFSDRDWTAAQAAEVIDFFKNDPTYGGMTLMGGGPNAGAPSAVPHAPSRNGPPFTAVSTSSAPGLSGVSTPWRASTTFTTPSSPPT